MSSLIKPELLAPAGNLKKLKLACDSGADAVYIGGTRFGLRKAADNFSLYEMAKGITYAHERGKKVYVVLNGMAHQGDIDTIITAIKELDILAPDAFIVSDLGVALLVKQYSTVAIHASTQASILNWRAAKVWQDMGADRVVVGRELTLKECSLITEKTGLEVETFIHGSMCISHSGKCHISNYFAGRDSNRGGCIQSCRFRYDMTIEGEDISATMMNARDIMAISLMPDIIKHSIASLKIEGRMKSELYISTAVRCYRKAIDTCYEQLQEGRDTDYAVESLTTELQGVSNRGFTTGNLNHKARNDSINFETAGYTRSTSFMGTLKGISAEGALALEVRENIEKGDTLEVVDKTGEVVSLEVKNITTLNGGPLERATPNKMVFIASDCKARVGALVRKQLKVNLRMQ